jgi:hypothetical protein
MDLKILLGLLMVIVILVSGCVLEESKNVELKTDKNIYESNDTINITVTNNLNISIWYIDSCASPIIGMYEFVDNKWVDISWSANATCGFSTKEISPLGTEYFELSSNNIKDLGSGNTETYKLSFRYYIEKPISWTDAFENPSYLIYSDVFIIK